MARNLTPQHPSVPGGPGYKVDEDLIEHYSAVREARGWSWDTLADEFEKQRLDPASVALAAWAREQGKGDKSARAKKSGTEKR